MNICVCTHRGAGEAIGEGSWHDSAFRVCWCVCSSLSLSLSLSLSHTHTHTHIRTHTKHTHSRHTQIQSKGEQSLKEPDFFPPQKVSMSLILAHMLSGLTPLSLSHTHTHHTHTHKEGQKASMSLQKVARMLSGLERLPGISFLLNFIWVLDIFFSSKNILVSLFYTALSGFSLSSFPPLLVNFAERAQFMQYLDTLTP
jgi:hypothetical protein